MDDTKIKKVREYAISHTIMGADSIHGIDHWDRVANNGESLNVPGADMEVVLYFAYLHDVERQSDAYDTEHGPRAASLIGEIRESVLSSLSDEQINLLKDACAQHTTVLRTGNPTIDTCFDADRLDLTRVGIIPDPQRMATKQGAEKAKNQI